MVAHALVMQCFTSCELMCFHLQLLFNKNDSCVKFLLSVGDDYNANGSGKEV